MADLAAGAKLPTITIVVPSFNQGGTIEETLVSIMDHNDTDKLETIVVDALSTDNTPEVLERWEKRVTVVKEKDKGQSDAINKGFRMAQGDILCWLNTDDLYFPGALDRVRKLFLDNPAKDIISGLGVHLKKDGSFLNQHPDGPDFSDPFAVRHMIFTVLQPSVFFRRSALERIGGINPRLEFLMDWDLWCRFYLAKTPWLKVDEYFSAARVYHETKTSRGKWRRITEHWRLAREHTGHLIPLATIQFFLFGALHYGNRFMRWLFITLQRIKRIITSQKKQKNTVYSLSSFSEFHGTGRVAFPWYGGSYSSMRLSLDIDPPPSDTADVDISVLYEDQKSSFHANVGANTFIMNTPENGALISVEITTDPQTTFRVTELAPQESAHNSE